MVLDWKSGESLSLIVVGINANPIERDNTIAIEDTKTNELAYLAILILLVYCFLRNLMMWNRVKI
jgi:hypothetical protein